MCGFDPDLCVDLILGVCGFDPDLCVDLIPLPTDPGAQVSKAEQVLRMGAPSWEAGNAKEWPCGAHVEFSRSRHQELQNDVLQAFARCAICERSSFLALSTRTMKKEILSLPPRMPIGRDCSLILLIFEVRTLRRPQGHFQWGCIPATRQTTILQGGSSGETRLLNESQFASQW